MCPTAPAPQVRRRAHAEEHLPPKPTLEEVEVASSGSELPMYFTRAPQLLNMFTQLEESNLFLIQNCQVGQEYDQTEGGDGDVIECGPPHCAGL